ncbi:hypothetical protein V8E55_007712 [Tylopilus felleus]
MKVPGTLSPSYHRSSRIIRCPSSHIFSMRCHPPIAKGHSTMPRVVSLVLLAAYAVNVVRAAPQTVPTSPTICDGYMWGITIQLLENPGVPVYNQYVRDTTCAGPAWVQSSTLPDPPLSIRPWGTEYDCEVPTAQYHCGETPVATCCGELGSTNILRRTR